MAQVSEADIRRALGGVIDPAQGKDVVSAGMVAGIAVKDGKVQVALAVRPEEARAKEALRQACEAAIDRLPGVLAASVVLTAERAAPAPPPRAGAPRGNAVPGIAAIIAVGSGKGGVGKSTTSANLACALAQRGLKVGLLDADVYGPSIPRLLGKEKSRPDASPDGKTMIPLSAWGVKLMSMGFLLPDTDTPIVWRGPMVQSALQQMLRQVQWGELDVLVVDLPPGTGDAQLTMAQQASLAGAVIVSTPQDVALLDARKALAMFRKVEVPILGMVENMSYFCCPNCGHRTDIFAHGGAAKAAEELKVPFLGEIPLHLAIRETSDAGAPIVASQPDSEHAKAYLALAARVQEALAAAQGRAAAPRISME